MYFKLKSKAGGHAEKGKDGKPVYYKAEDGCVIESTRDLVKAFPEKFERVDLTAAEAKKIAAENTQKETPKPEAIQQKETADAANPLGRDVTKRFPRAVEEDFMVIADGGAFFVVEKDDPQNPLHDKPLKKKDVVPFIDQYLLS